MIRDEIIRYLNQPYPYYYKGKKLWQIISLLFLLTFVYNYVLEPFEIAYDELKMSYFGVALTHSIAPFLILIPFSIIIAKLPLSTENWKLKNEFSFIIALIFLTGVLQFFLRDFLYNNSTNGTFNALLEEIVHTFIGGFFLAFMVVSANLNLQFLKNNEQALALNQKIKNDTTLIKHPTIEIETELKSETFLLDINSLVFAQSSGNYIELCLFQNNSFATELKRIKLKVFENYLNDFSQIIKTHRSFLVNIHFIDNVTGNAQGYKITLKNCNEIIPVSRTYLKDFNEKMSQL